MRFRKEHNILTGEDDYVLETRSQRAYREGVEGGAAFVTLIAVILMPLAWLLRRLGEMTEEEAKLANFGVGALVYCVLALLAWPFALILMFLPLVLLPLELSKPVLFTLIAAGSVGYWLLAIKLIAKRLKREMVRNKYAATPPGSETQA